MNITAGTMEFDKLNDKVRLCGDRDIVIDECYGQRFIASGLENKNIIINGVPGNALAAYFGGDKIVVNGNVQDAVGDTMNEGEIIVHGNAGDALGYAMRGGKIYIRGNSGYRTGIHMKQYKEKRPIIVVGGKVGSFLGEYLAGGLIIVLGLDEFDNKKNIEGIPAGDFIGTGMHGGIIYIRTESKPKNLPKQVLIDKATTEDIDSIKEYIKNYADYFNADIDFILDSNFYVLRPNAKNPYKQLYTAN